VAQDREALRWKFGEDAELYDRSRPGYPAELFADLPAAPARVLEIGCGTGQATVPLARLGHEVVAVELSPDMAAVARRRLASFPNARVEVSAFEDWPLDGRFDLVLSATAFHWLDPDVRMAKAADALRPGGRLAVVSTHHVKGGTEVFFAEAQRCYERFDPDTPPDLSLQPAFEVPTEPEEFDRSGRFGPVRFNRYEWEQDYRTDEYLDLLMTYSNHRALPAADREGLLACLRRLIDEEHGGRIAKRYLTELAIATVR
jgi:SAM-dependent methyltransferase